MRTDSWSHPGTFVERKAESEAATEPFEGCEALPFGPEIRVIPETQAGNTPSGLTVDVKDGEITTVKYRGFGGKGKN